MNKIMRTLTFASGAVLTFLFFYACTGSKKELELMSIKPAEAYNLVLSSPKYPDATFSFWLPELVIFDNDKDRAECKIHKDWYTQKGQSIIVEGETKGEQRVSFKCKLTPKSKDEILLTLNVRNTGDIPLSDYAHLAICLSPQQGVFWDSLGSRTYVNSKDGRLISILQNGDVKDFNHYPVGDRTDNADTEQRDPVSDGYVARTSPDGKLILSFCWDESARIDVNPGGLKCIHSHPAIGPLNPGERLTRKGLIMIKKSNVTDNYKLMQARISEYL